MDPKNDPNVENQDYSGFRKSEQWPDELPNGVTKDDATFYAYERVYNDGRREWVFFRRGKPLPDGQVPADAPIATMPDRPVKSVKDEWDKQQEKAAKEQKEAAVPPTVSAPPTQPNIVTRDPATGALVTQPNPNYTPPANATTAGQTVQVEGTPLPGGGFDNERPVKVTRDANGKQIGLPVPLMGAELEAWHEDRQRSRNPGRKTDADIAAEQAKAEERRRQDQKDQEAASVRNRPSVSIKEDGSGGMVAISTDPTTGAITTKPIPGVRGTPDRVTVDGTIYERGQDGAYAPAAGLPDKNKPVPTSAPRFTPDYSKDDLGLTDYNNALQDARAAGIIDRAQGEQLLTQAAGLATTTASHGTTLRSQAATTRGQDINQRGQDIGEVQSRRSAARGSFEHNNTHYANLALKMRGGTGNIAAEAFRASMLADRQNAADWGGMREIPRVPDPYMNAVRGVEDTQISIKPGGQIEVSPAGTAPAGAPPVIPTAPSASITPAQPMAVPDAPLPMMQPGPDPYMQALRPTFSPDRAALRSQFPELSDQDLDEVIAEGMMVA
jgi:hypothetical protein